MNAMTASSTLRRLITIAIFSSLASSMATVCSAEGGAGLPDRIVKFGDLDVSSSKGAVILYNRIRVAAEEVCAPVSHGDLSSRMHEKACVAQVIERAVTTVNLPALSEVFASKQQDKRPIALVAAQKP